MNALGTLLIWTGLQVTAYCSVAGAWYLAARRRNPAWRAAVLCGALVSTFAIALFAASPWPRWWSLPGTRSADRPSQQPSGANPTPLSQSASMRSPAASESDQDVKRARLPFRVIDVLSAMWDGVDGRPVAQQEAHVSDLRWRWPAWLAVTILMGTGIGLARVLLGWLALRRLLRGTRQVTDASLVSLAAELRGTLRCRKPIELREMSIAGSGGSPAVVGWRRPVIVFPAGWRSWSADARQGILAHETAHVARGDFLMWLVAQSGVIFNFYNPLVHWLARRLRLEQELAADACGAALAGGAKAYAAVLARMALEQDDCRQLWAGRPFFPTHGTLMRRIEMLHHQSSTATRLPSRLGVALSLAAMALVALAVTGVRAPAGAARAAEPETISAAAAAPLLADDGLLPTFDRSYLPADAIAIISTKPMALHNSDIVVRPTLMHFPQANGFAFGLSEKALAWEIEEVKTIGFAPAQASSPEPARSTEPPFVMIYRMRQPYDRGKLRAEIFGEAPDGVTETTCHGHDCLSAVSETSGDLIHYLLVDDRTFVVMRDRDVPRVLAADQASRPAWYGEWQKIADSPMAVALDSAAMAAVDSEPTDDPQEQFYRSMLHTTALVFAHVDSTPDGLTIGASAQCRSPEQAALTIQLAKTGMAGLVTALTEPPQILEASMLPPEYQALDVAGAVVKTLSELKMDASETRVTAEARFDADFVVKFAEATNTLLARQTEEYKARVKADGPVHIEKLGRLAAAFHAYRAAHGHYPPAAVVGPDGKTMHSWRVELLPYLSEQKLFEQYKLDEPWDSEHNKQLIEKIPEIYSTTEASKKGSTDYFVVSGKATRFDDAPRQRQSVSEAPGATILVLQSQRHTPWTKPLDIDPETNLSELRQYRDFGDGFYVAFTDGTVRLVPMSTDPATIRAMLVRAAGGEEKLR